MNNLIAENPSLKALHLNIHSLPDKIDKLKLLMDKLYIKFDWNSAEPL